MKTKQKKVTTKTEVIANPQPINPQAVNPQAVNPQPNAYYNQSVPNNPVNFNNNTYGSSMTSPTATVSSKTTNKKTGCYITGLVTTILSILTIIFSAYFIFQSLEGSTAGIGEFIAYLFVLGPISLLIFLLAIGLLIVSLTFSILTIKSSKKFFKASGIILTVLNSLMVFGYVILIFYILISLLNA